MSASKREGVQIFEPPPDATAENIHQALERGELALQGLMPWSSNYTFLALITCDLLKFSVVYKPCRGERPLWDFEPESLCQREVAAYFLSRALGGWPAIPPTVLRDGPHGIGSVQQFMLTDYEVHYFTIQDELRFQLQFQQLAIFDYLINNADRKGGHCLLGEDDTIWAIDHGLTFHTDYKLRTVIWDHAHQEIPHEIYGDLKNFKQAFTPDSEIYKALQKLLSRREIDHLCYRLDDLLASGRFPAPLGRRDYPYPPV